MSAEELYAQVETDKLMDKNFKKEFPGLGFHQVTLKLKVTYIDSSKVDSLYKLFKKRPKAAERLEKSAEAWSHTKHDSRSATQTLKLLQ